MLLIKVGRNKQTHEMAGLNVVTFLQTYKPSHIIAKRIIDILGTVLG